MNERNFDAFIRHAAAAIPRRASLTPSRRDIARALAGLTFGGIWGPSLGIGEAEARKKGKRKKRKKRKNTSKTPGCTPNCNDRTCGADDCGGSCGSCPAGQSCQGGNCVCPSGQQDCQGTCIPASQCCTGANCGVGQICTQGQCVTGTGTSQQGEDVCIDLTDVCGGDDCYCYTSMSNETRCGLRLPLISDCHICPSDAACEALFPDIPGVFCIQDTGDNCACGGTCVAPCAA